MFFRSLAHALRSLELMKLPSQKMAVWALHPPVQVTVRLLVQLALPMVWQAMSQLALASPVQLPWQLAMHDALQLVEGGVPLQPALQRASQLAWHWPVHVVMSLEDAQALEQLPSHVALQSASQLKLPGLEEHMPAQVPSQLLVQLGSVAVHPPEQLASSWASHAICRFGGEQAMSHDAVASTVHDSLPLKTAPPQSAKMSARAEPAANVTIAPATTATREDQLSIGNTSSVETIPDGRARGGFLQGVASQRAALAEGSAGAAAVRSGGARPLTASASGLPAM